MLDHFSHSKLACPTMDQVRLASGFGEALEKLRIKLDAPIYLNSVCRSPSHNAKVKAPPVACSWSSIVIGVLVAAALLMPQPLMAGTGSRSSHWR